MQLLNRERETPRGVRVAPHGFPWVRLGSQCVTGPLTHLMGELNRGWLRSTAAGGSSVRAAGGTWGTLGLRRSVRYDRMHDITRGCTRRHLVRSGAASARLSPALVACQRSPRDRHSMYLGLELLRGAGGRGLGQCLPISSFRCTSQRGWSRGPPMAGPRVVSRRTARLPHAP